MLLQLNQEALDLKLVELYRTPQGAMAERPAPSSLRSGEVVVLDIYGSLFYAGARTLEARLPDPAGTHSPAVVLRLRGRTTLGATSFEVLAKYAERLHAVHGRLVLSGLDASVVEQLRRYRRGSLDGTVEVLPATDVLMESTILGLDRATSWLVEHRPPDPGAEH
jgi:SulP family sulfate permease